MKRKGGDETFNRNRFASRIYDCNRRAGSAKNPLNRYKVLRILEKT
jgi:hypothetical protein